MPASKVCSVCNQRLGRECRCPWDKPFEAWPEPLRRTVEALVAGGPREP